jgi:ankyrin repeat protein
MPKRKKISNRKRNGNLQDVKRHHQRPRHHAIKHGQSESKVLAIINECPQEVKVRDNNDQLPLHLACSPYDVSETIIKQLISVYPEYLQCPDQYGSLPFHLLLESSHWRHHWSDDLIMFLMTHYPVRTQLVDKLGHYPIHVACFGISRSRHINVILKLIEAYPTVTEHADKNWQLSIA